MRLDNPEEKLEDIIGKGLDDLEESSVSVVTYSWALHYDNIESLVDAADLVVEGYVSNQKGTSYLKKGDYGDYQLLVDFKAKHVYKGNQEMDTEAIKVAQTGGTDGSTLVVSPMVTPLEQGQRAILFLRSQENGTYKPINEDLSVYVQDNENKKYRNAFSKEFISGEEIELKINE